MLVESIWIDQEHEFERGGDAVAMDGHQVTLMMENLLDSRIEGAHEMEFDDTDDVEEMDAVNDQDEYVNDDAMIDVQTRMKQRGCFKLESNDQTSLEEQLNLDGSYGMNDNVVEEEQEFQIKP